MTRVTTATLFFLLRAAPIAMAATDDEASPPPSVQEEAPPPADAGAALEGAKATYFEGRHSEAVALLRDLQGRIDKGEIDDPEIVAEVLIYLGEIQYVLGDERSARAAFRLLLERDPDYPTISPYRHPNDVVGVFELVRQSVLEDRAALLADPGTRRTRTPMPAWGYAPLGIPQFVSRRPARGAMYATLQVGLGAASIGTWIAIAREVPPKGSAYTEDQKARLTALTYGLQWPLTAGAWLSWAISSIDAGIAWKREHPRPTGIGFVPRAGRGGEVVVNLSF